MSIVVSRSYNTLNADKEGEFGYGWSLDLSNTQVEVKYPAGTDGSTAFEGMLPLFRDADVCREGLAICVRCLFGFVPARR